MKNKKIESEKMENKRRKHRKEENEKLTSLLSYFLIF